MPLIRARPKADHGYLLRLSSILEARKEWGRFPTVRPISDWKRDFPLILGGEIRKSWLSLSRKKRNRHLLFGRQFWRHTPIALVDELHDDLANHSTGGRPVDFTPFRTIPETRFRLLAGRSKARGGYLGRPQTVSLSNIPDSKLTQRQIIAMADRVHQIPSISLCNFWRYPSHIR